MISSSFEELFKSIIFIRIANILNKFKYNNYIKQQFSSIFINISYDLFK